MSELVIGMDVGSTTVKAVVIEPESKKIIWHDYQRHHTKQPEKVLELLTNILDAFPDQPKDGWRMFLTGSGSGPMAAARTSPAWPRAERAHPHRTGWHYSPCTPPATVTRGRGGCQTRGCQSSIANHAATS